MNKVVKIFSDRIVFIVSLFFAAAILTFLAPKAAVNIDEQLHYPHAKKVVNWYLTGGKDSSCLHTPETNLKYYGQSVDNFTALINRIFLIKNEFLTRHFTGAFFFWLLLLFAGLISKKLSGSFWLSSLTVLSLLAMPRLFGQAFGNLKDIPFAAGYTAAIYYIICFLKEMPKTSWSTTIRLGLAIAFTCSVRIGGLILPTYLIVFSALFIILKPFVPKQNVSTKPCLVRLLGQGIVIVLTGYFVGLLFWPFALQDVFRNPIESLQLMEHYKISIRQIFEGDFIWSTQLPWYYLPKWILISTPEFIFLGLLFYLFYFFKNFKKIQVKQLILELFLVFTLLFPVVYVIIINANLYSGLRQLIFILPILAIIGSYGLFLFLKTYSNKILKTFIIILSAFLIILPIKHQIKNFPVDYVYFNTVSGGNKKAWSNYEYDYYFHALKESSEYLINIVGNKKVTVATNCILSNYFEDSENINYQYTRYLERSSTDWDYALFGINYIHPELLKDGKWFSNQTIKIFFQEENPVAVLLKRDSKHDYEGIKQTTAGNNKMAKALIETALLQDKNNIWLYAQLAKIALEEKDYNAFNKYLTNGKEIFAKYEPFFLLEGQYYFSIRNFEKAKSILDELFEINPRYKPAIPLLNAVNKELK